MKSSNFFIVLAVLVVGAGCRSDQPQVTSTTTSHQVVQTREQSPTTESKQVPGGSTVQRGTTGDVDYTIESIPNPHLTPTSREGDKPREVYSSNIIAVHVYPKGGATNAPAAPNSENTSQPERK